MRINRRLGVGGVAIIAALSLAACGQSSTPDAEPTPAAATVTQTPEPVAPAPAPDAALEAPIKFNSEFSRDGTYQSHKKVKGVDFVYTIWAAKTTPRMQEWAPLGSKYFSFTFQGYDTRARMRDPFSKKRMVWMKQIKITSVVSSPTVPNAPQPYRINELARDVTFDPEARSLEPYGMLITSPKGAFELRNQSIKEMPVDTEGVTLFFTATVFIQKSPTSTSYTRHKIKLALPIAIYNDGLTGETTIPQPVPYNAT